MRHPIRRRALCVAVLQLLLGVAALVATGASAGVSPQPAYSYIIATLHQTTGAALLGLAVFAAVWIRRRRSTTTWSDGLNGKSWLQLLASRCDPRRCGNSTESCLISTGASAGGGLSWPACCGPRPGERGKKRSLGTFLLFPGVEDRHNTGSRHNSTIC